VVLGFFVISALHNDLDFEGISKQAQFFDGPGRERLGVRSSMELVKPLGRPALRLDLRSPVLAFSDGHGEEGVNRERCLRSVGVLF
jgi:hypothetical protein